MRQMRLGRVTQDAALFALGQFMLAQGAQEACRRPAFGISGLRDGRPQPGDRGQAQLGQHHRQARDINADRLLGFHVCAHAAVSIQVEVSSSAS